MRALLLIYFIIFLSFNSHSQSGQLDPTFGDKGIITLSTGAAYKNFNSSATQVLAQSDGSLILLLDRGSRLSKRLPNGSLDSSYGFTGYSRSVSFSESFAVIQPDNKIVVAGHDSHDYFILSRINTDGSIDQNFGDNGTQITMFPGRSTSNSVTTQADGKVVVAGYTDLGSSDYMYFAIARYNTDGTPDSTFNGSGKQTTDFEFQIPDRYGTFMPVHFANANAVKIQNDGKIVVAGFANDGGDLRFAVARYNPDGLLDSTFDTDGLQTTKINALQAQARSIVIQNDGKIVLSGKADDYGNSNTLAVVRYNSDGSLDSNFDGDGISVLTTGYDVVLTDLPVQSVALQIDGKIVVSGYTSTAGSNDFFAARLNANGSMDNTFDNDGVVTTDVNSSDDYAGSVLIQNDGKILIAGTSAYYPATGYYSKFDIIRYNLNGSTDINFGNNGKLQDNFSAKATYFKKSELQKDGKLISVGYAWNGNDYDFLVARFNTNGSVDSSFNGIGQQVNDFGSNEHILSVIAEDDGKISLLGNSNSLFAMCRYNPDGTPDQTFHGNGKFTLDVGLPFTSIAVQNDGKILLAGITYDGINNGKVALCRLNPDGTFDNSFGNAGKVLDDLGIDILTGIFPVFKNDGKIVLVTRTYNNQNYIVLVRYNQNGTIDATFSNDGLQTSVFGPGDYFAKAASIQSDGKIVVAGYIPDPQGVTASYLVARYKTNGDPDSTFGINGFQSTNVGPGFNIGESVAISKKGKIAVGGSNDNFAIVMYNSDGSLDQSFSGDGIKIDQLGIDKSTIYHLMFSDDKLYATGVGMYPGTSGVVARYVFAEGGALPVSLIDFTGSLLNKSVILNWKIVSDKKLNRFIIERSGDARSFVSLQSIQAIGPVSILRNYSTTDASPLQGINYYRLKMVDDDGQFIYSNVVAVRINQDEQLQIFPNPAGKILYVSANGNNERAIAEIIDGNGRKLKAVNVILNGATSFSLDVSSLPKALYHLVLRKDSGVEVRTFIKN
ncbi:MAG: T9SS type A sorting domain-containing protein [Ginsengibacter sp.]